MNSIKTILSMIETKALDDGLKFRNQLDAKAQCKAGEVMRSELFEEAWKQNRHVWESTKCLAQAMYLAGEKHQQSKVDELEQIIKLRDQQLTEEIGLSTKYVAKCDDLQKRVDAALQVAQSMRKEIEHGHLSDDESQTLSSYANELEQALKGGGE